MVVPLFHVDSATVDRLSAPTTDMLSCVVSMTSLCACNVSSMLRSRCSCTLYRWHRVAHARACVRWPFFSAPLASASIPRNCFSTSLSRDCTSWMHLSIPSCKKNATEWSPIHFFCTACVRVCVCVCSIYYLQYATRFSVRSEQPYAAHECQPGHTPRLCAHVHLTFSTQSGHIYARHTTRVHNNALPLHHEAQEAT
jgi:hypothetical protein